MNPDPLDLRLSRFRSRRDEYPHALATALIEAGRPREALEVVRLGLESHADDPALVVLEGRAWFEDGDLAQAQASLLRAAKLNPRDKEPYRWLAQVLLMRGDPKRASQVLDRALAIDPDDRPLQQQKHRADRLAGLQRASSTPPRPSAPEPFAKPEVTPQPRGEKRSAVFGKVAPSERPPAVELKIEHFERDPDTLGPQRAELGRLIAPVAHNQQGARGEPVAPARVSQPALPRAPLPRAPLPIPPREARVPSGGQHDEEDEDAPTIAAETPKEVQRWLDSERADSERLEAERGAAARFGSTRALPEQAEAAPVAEALVSSFAQPASESGVSLDVLSADLSEVAPQVEPPGQPESPEAVLAVLKDHGVFQSPASQAQTPTWVPEAEAGASGQRVSRSIMAAWLVAVLGAGGGYYGFSRWLDARRGDAHSLVVHATALAETGDYPALLAAERELASARSLDPKSREALEELLFVHAARALEDASGELGYLHQSLSRASEHSVDDALVTAARAVVGAYEGKPDEARSAAEAAAKAADQDARVAYLVGRLYARAGRADAGALLASAVEKDPALALAWLARAELAREQGLTDDARALFAKARGKEGAALRAELWLLLMDAEGGDAAALQQRFDALQKRVDAGSRSEKLLAVAVRAELALRAGKRDEARAALEGVGDLGVRDPEVMYVLAVRALRADAAQVAYRTARAAATLSPSSARYRDALIEALILRGDGDAALRALPSDAQGPDSAFVRARAALLGDASAALEEAKRGLVSLKPSEPAQQAARSSLLSRVDVRLGASPESLLPAARTLAQRAKDQVLPQLSVAELALGARQPKDAAAAAQRALALVPDDAEALTLLGRAQRMGGEIEAAKATLQRAVELAPARRDAGRALASLLLDSGDAASAERLYENLVRSTGSLRDTLGVVEAELALGALGQAAAQLEKLSPEDREGPGARMLTARLALAQRKGSAALEALAPLVAEDEERHTAELMTLQGDALFALGRVDSAAGAYEDALDIDADFPEALIGRASASLRAEKLGQTAELVTRAEQALATRLRPPAVHGELAALTARLAFDQKDFARVRDVSEAALARPAAPAELHFWLAEAFAKLKNPAATEHYSRYLERESDGPYAARAKRAIMPR
jgi:tetratricopeptide (TPR) repeat protein